MSTYSNRSSRFTSDYWAPENMANWGTQQRQIPAPKCVQSTGVTPSTQVASTTTESVAPDILHSLHSSNVTTVAAINGPPSSTATIPKSSPTVRPSLVAGDENQNIHSKMTPSIKNSSSPTLPRVVRSYIPPAIRPAKTVTVIRRVICHDLGIKVPRSFLDQPAKDMEISEQAFRRLANEKRERRKANEE